MNKIIKYFLISLSLIFIYQFLIIENNIDLGHEYKYIYESECVVGKYDIPSYIKDCWYNNQYIIARQTPNGYIIDPIFNIEGLKFSQGLDATYYWIIDKINNIRYGVLTESEFTNKLDSLNIKIDNNWSYINSKKE